MNTILVADDDKKVTAALARRLEARGYGVLIAHSGHDALKLAVSNQPDLILMDIWMPAGIGFSVAERLHALGIITPIIFLTASRKPGLWSASQEIGAAAFIEKPYEPDILLETVKQTLASTLQPTQTK